MHEGKKPKGTNATFSAVTSYSGKDEQILKMKFDPTAKYDRQQDEGDAKSVSERTSENVDWENRIIWLLLSQKIKF